MSFGTFLKVFLVTNFGSILPQELFFFLWSIFTLENICHYAMYVEQMFLNDILFGCEIWTEPSNFAKQKTEKLSTSCYKLWQQKSKKWPKLVAIKMLPTLVLYLTVTG